MAIKNYTTKVDVYTTVGEIQNALARAGASKIIVDYDRGKPQAVMFCLNTAGGMRGFTLPAPVEGTLRVFAAQKIKVDQEQAEKTAWRNIRDWVLAQTALVECCNAPMDQVFLPYLTNNKGQTLFEVYSSGNLMLEE